MKILISYRGIPNSPGWETGSLLSDAFEELGHEVCRYGHYYEKSWQSPISDLNPSNIMDCSFDYTIYCECNDPDPQYVELKHVKSTKKVYWEFDTSYHLNLSEAICNYFKFDHVFYANYKCENFFKRFTPLVTWLPYGLCQRKHFTNFTNKKFLYTIVGSPWAERKEIADTLKTNGIEVEFITGKFREEYVRALAQSQATINFNKDEGRGLLVMRVFEALGTKTCLITNNGDYVEEVLRPGVECIVYKDMNELVEICQRYKNSQSDLEWIANFGYERGMREHTYEARAQQMINALEAL